MKLLVDARSLVDASSGGVARVARELVSAYARKFPQDEIICVTTGVKKPLLDPRLAAAPNVRHVHLTIPNKIWSLLSFAGLVSLVGAVERRSGACDAVFFPNIGFIGSTRGPRNLVLLLHDLSFLIEPLWFQRKQRLWHRAVRATALIRNATRILAVSETTKRDAIRLLGIPAERITVIPIGPTLTSPPVSNDKLPTMPYLLALGDGDPRKNSATARIAAERSQIRLFLLGNDDVPSDAELASIYMNASAFLYPSWYEGYGLPLHEAAQFGTPRIASTSGALPETAPPGTFFANPAKPHQWVEAVKLALDQQHRPIQLDPDAWKKAAEILHHSFL